MDSVINEIIANLHEIAFFYATSQCSLLDTDCKQILCITRSMMEVKLKEEQAYASSLLTSIVTHLILIINYSNKLNIHLDLDFKYHSNIVDLITRDMVSSVLDNFNASNLELVSTILLQNYLCTEFQLSVEQRKRHLETRYNSELARFKICVALIHTYQSDLSQFHREEKEYVILDLDATEISKYDEYYKLCQSLQIELQNKTREIIDNLIIELKKLYEMCFFKQDDLEKFINALGSSVTNQNFGISEDDECHLELGLYTLSSKKCLETEILRLKKQYSSCKQIYNTINQRITLLQVLKSNSRK
jgi:ribosome-associated toxin RatA of RatAB toxin-antitoxin module